MLKTATSLVIFLISIIGLVSLSQAIPPPDNSTSGSVSVKDSINVRMSNVDDIGLVLVWNGHGAETVAHCEWTSGGNHGYASEQISNRLTKGKNYIVFVLYNKVYAGSGFFAGGKWSGEMSITKNGDSYWSKSKYARENNAEIKYWKVIMADVSASGRVTLSQDIPSSELSKLRNAMRELENKLDRNTGFSTPF